MNKQAAEIARVARERFGFDHLRPGQEAAIRAVIAGRDTLAVLPTGSGKSAIYQIAATLLDGPAIVVSPLIALQRDQVEHLEEHGEAAAELNSTRPAGERRETLADVAGGELAFLFLAPEQFANEETLAQLRAARPALFVVDEAHCISEWGHDFRPDYLRLGTIVEELGHPTVLALTATAAPPVREEIVARLGLRDPAVVVRGFDRPNLWLGVERHETPERQREALLDRVLEAEKPGIVYAATRRDTEEIAATFAERGVRAAPYHAGLATADREATQVAFMADDLDVIVATVAFGMGIDKPNVRFVFHAAISDSLDSYYQEIGRAGRDGTAARALLFYRAEDVGLRRFFAGGGQVDEEQIEQVVRAVREHDAPVEPGELQEATGLSQSKLTTAIGRLEEVGAVAVLPDGAVAPGERAGEDAAVADAAMAQANRKEFERSRLEMMRGYAETRDCRRRALLSYFGESYEQPCGNCDNCAAGRAPEVAGDEPFPPGSRVVHRAWGAGLVLRYEGEKVVVLFDEVGYKTLATAMVLEQGLLAPADDQ